MTDSALRGKMTDEEARRWVYRMTTNSLRRLENRFAFTDEGKSMTEEDRALVRAHMLGLAIDLEQRCSSSRK